MAPVLLGTVLQAAPTGMAAQAVGSAAPWTADLEQAGVTVDELGHRFLGTQVLEAASGHRDLGSLLSTRAIRGLRVIRDPGHAHGGQEIPLCILLRPYREGDPSTGCLPFRLDGRDAPQGQVVTIPPDRMYSVVVLEGREARRVIGPEGRPGAVLIYTGGTTGPRD
jgi:hypothetical protein